MKIILLLISLCIWFVSCGQKIETAYLNKRDSTSNMYVAVIPENQPIHSFLFLLDGFGADPKSILSETDIPSYASQKGIITFMPLLKTGALYFRSDAASQQSLKEMIEQVASIYKLKGKPFYIGGFSIGGTCAVKYAELAIKNNYPIKPNAVFAVDPPLDWERFYNASKRVVRLSHNTNVNEEVVYMIERIEKEMKGTPETAIDNFYRNSPYSFSDTTQQAIKTLATMPVRIISEPDIQWWLSNRGYDYDYINITDQAAMINELQKMGNKNALLITTTNKGYRNSNALKHPHSWSIADAKETIEWLQSQN